MNRCFHQMPHRGSSLITTLLVIMILSIIVTAFLQSMMVERQTARSYMNLYRADLAAQAAANQSQNLLENLFLTYPDSSTGWATFTNTRGTVFYYRTIKDTDAKALPKEPQVDLKALPLISGGTPQLISALSEESAFPDGLGQTNSVNLNRDGWLGGPTEGEKTRTTRVQWVDLLEDPSKPRDNTFDASTGRPKNGPIARYAFWIEDESFRVNMNVAGAKPRKASTPGGSPTEASLQGTTTAVAGAPDLAQAAVSLREGLEGKKFLTPSQIGYAVPGQSDAYNKLRFFLTTNSGALNFSRGGVKRLKLNDVVQQTTVNTEIRAQLDRIIGAIKNDNAMPDYGQRFYHLDSSAAALNSMTGVTPDHADIYLQKIAANIRDYIDTDSQPTIVENDIGFSVREADKPTSESPIGFGVPGPSTGDNDVAAIGKERVPALQESALRIKLKTFTVGQSSAHYKFEQDYYFEFFNPTNKDILTSNLEPNPFLLISNQFGYDTNGGTQIRPGRPFSIPLANFVDGSGNPLTKFPAGAVTVLTTDSSPSEKLENHGVKVSSFFRPSSALPDDRVYEGDTKKKSNSKYRVFAQMGNTYGRGGSSTTDFDTHVLLGNDTGLIESFTALPVPAALSIHNDDGDRMDVDRWFFQGGSLKGNGGTGSSMGAPAQTGDPRSLNEQLNIQRWAANSQPDSARFFTSGLDSGPPGNSNLGYFQNGYVILKQWPDFLGSPSPIDPSNAETAPAVIADAKLDSIGQLGDVYDPSRMTVSERNIALARGGGRTFRIGQSDAYNTSATSANQAGLWDGEETSVSRNRTSWRLADVFSTTSDTETPGVVNINGVGRDNGAALRALFYQLKFSTDDGADATIQGKKLTVDELVKAAQLRFPSSISGAKTPADPSQDKPLWERGEISELQDDATKYLFNESSKLAGVEMQKVLDRGREELVRRAIEMITTKGNVYTAYCIGQAVSTNRAGAMRVLSTKQIKITFKLEPVYTTPLPGDTHFDASTEEGLRTRFREPDSFTAKVLAVDNI